jgi:hypothetical protein
VQLGEFRIDSTAVVSILRSIVRGHSLMDSQKMGTGWISVKGCLGEIGLVRGRGGKRSKSARGCSSQWQLLYWCLRYANIFASSGRHSHSINR